MGTAETPVIVILRENMVLLHDGERHTVEVIPDLYHRIKAISHISFGVYVTLANNGYGPLREDIRIDLEDKLVMIERALAVLDEEPIPPSYIEIQRKTLVNARDFIAEILDAGGVQETKLKAFGNENVPLYLENTSLCARLEIDMIHEAVMNWKDHIGPENWQAIHVVICAGHQARYRETNLQYFQRLLHEKESIGAGMEDRVIYGENIHDVDAALDLLARHIIDQRASLDLFNSRTRLQQDLMSDGAAAYLEKLLPD